MPFDYKAAHDAGVSDEDIVGELSSKLGYNLAAAKDSGLTTPDVLPELLKKANATPAPIPTPPEPSLGEKAVGVAKAVGKGILEQGKRDARILSTMATHPDMVSGIGQLVGYGLGKAPNPEKQIRQNLSDLVLTGFDVGTVALGGPLNSVIREAATKVGLKGALGHVLSGAAEGAGYGATYEGLDAAIQGDTARSTAERMARGTGIGALAGGTLGGGAALIERAALARSIKIKADAIAQETAAKSQAVDTAKLMLQDSGLTPDEVHHVATQAISQGVPPEEAARQYREAFNAARGAVTADKEAALRVYTEGKTNQFSTGVAKGFTQPPMLRSRAPRPGAPSAELPRGSAGIPGPSDEEIRRSIIGLSPEQDASINQAFDQAVVPQPGPIEVAQRGKNVPFKGLPQLQKATRATESRPTLKENLATVKRLIQGTFVAEPGMNKQIQDTMLQGMRQVLAATERADQTLEDQLLPLLGKGRKQIGQNASDLSDYMTSLDRITRLKTFGGQGPEATPVEAWQAQAHKLAREVSPDVLAAHGAARNILDNMWERAHQRGYLTEAQYHEDYTPTQRLFSVAESLRRETPDTTPIGRKLSQMLERKASGEYNETDIVKLLRQSLSALNRKEAEDDLFIALRQLPDVDLTSHFGEGEVIPKGYALYRPGPGMPGWKANVGNDESRAATAGFNHGLAETGKIRGDTYAPGSYVLPELLVKRLNQLYPNPVSEYEKSAYGLGRLYARQLTVFSPTNTPLNAMSDTPLAALYAGQHGYLPGFIRFYPRAVKSSFMAAFGKQNELYRRAVREGIAGSTQIHSFGGESMPSELSAALAEGARGNPFGKIPMMAYRARTAVEAVPRIAGGLAAEAKTGLGSEFGRVGAEITLPYGAGDPAISRAPVMSLLAPFWKFTGMATKRVMDTAKTPAGLATMAAPAVAAALWNFQNEEFKQAEYSLPGYERTHMHFILRTSDGKVARDKNGRPMVWRARFWVPEEAASFFGLGNLPGRAIDVARGYSTPGEFLTESGAAFGQNVAGLPAGIQSLSQIATGRSSLTGQQMEASDRMAGLLPGPYFIAKTIEQARNQGIGPALAAAPGRIVGIRPMGMIGGSDAKLVGLRVQIADAEQSLRSAARARNQVRVEHFKKKIAALGKRIERLQAVNR